MTQGQLFKACSKIFTIFNTRHAALEFALRRLDHWSVGPLVCPTVWQSISLSVHQSVCNHISVSVFSLSSPALPSGTGGVYMASLHQKRKLPQESMLANLKIWQEKHFFCPFSGICGKKMPNFEQQSQRVLPQQSQIAQGVQKNKIFDP